MDQAAVATASSVGSPASSSSTSHRRHEAEEPHVVVASPSDSGISVFGFVLQSLADLHRRRLLDAEAKSLLKNLACQRDERVLGAFEAHSHHPDETELLETLHCIIRIHSGQFINPAIGHPSIPAPSPHRPPYSFPIYYPFPVYLPAPLTAPLADSGVVSRTASALATTTTTTPVSFSSLTASNLPTSSILPGPPSSLFSPPAPSPAASPPPPAEQPTPASLFTLSSQLPQASPVALSEIPPRLYHTNSAPLLTAAPAELPNAPSVQNARSWLEDRDAVPNPSAVSRSYSTPQTVGSASFPQLPGERKLHVGFLISQPLVNQEPSANRIAPMPPWDVPQEMKELFEAVSGTGRGVKYSFAHATIDNLREMVLRQNPCVLHFSGHGASTYLPFENGEGGIHKVDVKILSEIIRPWSKTPRPPHNRSSTESFLNSHSNPRHTPHAFSYGGQISHHAAASSATPNPSTSNLNSHLHPGVQLVFVSACYSRQAGMAFVEAGVPHVVAVHIQARISDDSCRKFASGFYMALFRGLTVREAFESGTSAVKGNPRNPPPCCCMHPHKPNCPHVEHGSHMLPDPKNGNKFVCCCAPTVPHDDSQKFVLLPENGNHEVVLFSSLPLGSVTPIPQPGHLPSVPPHFCGREIDMWLVIKALVGQPVHRLVTIRGAPGVGKTAAAKAVARYLAYRHVFGADDTRPGSGIFFVRTNGKSTAEAVRHAIAAAVANQQRSASNGNEEGEHAGSLDQSVSAQSTLLEWEHEGGGGAGLVPLDNESFCERLRMLLARDYKERRCLLVLDSIEDALHKDKAELQALLSRLYDHTQLSFLITSREALGSLPDAVEKIFVLEPLSPADGARLFLAHASASKPIYVKDIDLKDLSVPSHSHSHASREERNRLALQLQQIVQRLKNDPQAPVTPQILEFHPVLQYFGGHPQAIKIGAALLQDGNLKNVYAILKSARSHRSAQGPELLAFHSSVDVSIQHLRQTNPEAVHLFCLLALLPAGALQHDLDCLWRMKCGEEPFLENAASKSSLPSSSETANDSAQLKTPTPDPESKQPSLNLTLDIPLTDWIDGMKALVKASLVNRISLADNITTVLQCTSYNGTNEHYVMFPVVFHYAKSVVSRADFTELFVKLAYHYANVVQELYERMARPQSAKGAYAVFEREEQNLWHCLQLALEGEPTSILSKRITSLPFHNPSLHSPSSDRSWATHDPFHLRRTQYSPRTSTPSPSSPSVNPHLVPPLVQRPRRNSGTSPRASHATPPKRISASIHAAMRSPVRAPLSPIASPHESTELSRPHASPLVFSLDPAEPGASPSQPQHTTVPAPQPINPSEETAAAALPSHPQPTQRIFSTLPAHEPAVESAEAAMSAGDQTPRHSEDGNASCGSAPETGVSLSRSSSNNFPIIPSPSFEGFSSHPAGMIGYQLPRLLQMVGRRQDGIRAGELGLRVCRHLADQVGAANCLLTLSWLCDEEEKKAVRYCTDALDLFRQVGNTLGVANALEAQGHLLKIKQPEAAMKCFSEALALFSQMNSSLGKTKCLLALGDLQRNSFKMSAAAQQSYEQALKISRKIEDGILECSVCCSLAELLIEDQTFDGARNYIFEGLLLSRRILYRQGEANLLMCLGDLEEMVGANQEAESAYSQAQGIFRLLDDTFGEARAAAAIAQLQLRQAIMDDLKQTHEQLDQFEQRTANLQTDSESSGMPSDIDEDAMQFPTTPAGNQPS